MTPSNANTSGLGEIEKADAIAYRRETAARRRRLDAAPVRAADVDAAIAALPTGIRERVDDNAALERLIFEVFYGTPLAFSTQVLALAIQRYLLCLPLKSEEEARAEYLDSLTPQERADWWKAHNFAQTSLERAALQQETQP